MPPSKFKVPKDSDKPTKIKPRDSLWILKGDERKLRGFQENHAEKPELANKETSFQLAVAQFLAGSGALSTEQPSSGAASRRLFL